MNNVSVLYQALSLLNTITYVLSQSLNGECPIQFEAYTNSAVFQDFCSVYHFNLDRVLEPYRDDVCYSQCTVSDTCWYYYYESATSQCHVCLRKPHRFHVNGLMSELAESVNVPAVGESFQARIGRAIEVQSQEYLYMDCSSPYIGRPDGLSAPLGISLANGISEIQFCQFGTNYIGGFRVVSRDGDSDTIGCTHSSNNWNNHAALVIAENEDITRLDLYMNSYGLKAVNVTTSDDNYYHFVSMTDFDPDLTRSVRGRRIIDMDATIKNGGILGEIQVQFEDCE